MLLNTMSFADTSLSLDQKCYVCAPDGKRRLRNFSVESYKLSLCIHVKTEHARSHPALVWEGRCEEEQEDWSHYCRRRVDYYSTRENSSDPGKRLLTLRLVRVWMTCIHLHPSSATEYSMDWGFQPLLAVLLRDTHSLLAEVQALV